MDKKEYFRYLNTKNQDKRFESLEKLASELHIPIIQKEGLDFISMLIKGNNVIKILEIGTAIAYSAISFALLDDKINITTIERDKEMILYAKKHIKEFELEDRIQLIEEDALEINESDLPKDFDLLFIDAAKSQYQKFFMKFTPCLKQGGIVVTDNLIFHDLVFEDTIKNRNTRQLVKKIKNYNDWLKNKSDFQTYFFDIGDGISVSIKK